MTQLTSTFEQFTGTIEAFDNEYAQDITASSFFEFPLKPVLEAEQRLTQMPNTAYLSMEYGLSPSIYHQFASKKPLSNDNQFSCHEVFSNQWDVDHKNEICVNRMLDIPIYSGGLGVLAGDSVKSAADLNLPLVAVGVLWNKGYFKQKFWYKRGQLPEELKWDPASYPGLIPLKHRIVLGTKEGDLIVRLWKYYIYSEDFNYALPLILLDTDIEENKEEFRRLTDQLYRSDDVRWKIFQRLILGVGAVKALQSLQYNIERYHLNEGHAAFAIVEKYLQEECPEDIDAFKQQFVYTCHTPVIAGHDRFAIHDLQQFITQDYIDAACRFGRDPEAEDLINLTYLSLNATKRFNAVAQKHGEVMRLQFPDFSAKVNAVTNGIHLYTWLSEHTESLFDQYQNVFGNWRKDSELLKNVHQLKNNAQFRADLFAAHQKNKRELINVTKPWGLDENVFTIAWARRITGYKRPALLFHDVERILELADKYGKIQILFAGKAHPNDDIGGAHIEEILSYIDALNHKHDKVKVLILENYDTYFGKLLTSAVDVWLNNPLPPFEASGTSGMKAIANGVLQLTTLDGWVVEAQDDDIGWVFGYEHTGTELGDERQLRLDEDADALYKTLAKVLELYYKTNDNGVINIDSLWLDKMINAISCAGFFNTQRMMMEYKKKIWK